MVVDVTNELMVPETSGAIITLNNSSGSVKIMDAIPANYRVTRIVIQNKSTGGQTLSVGLGQNAIIGVDEIGQGNAWIEAIDAEFRPWNGDIRLIASADGALYTFVRQIERKVS